jgi:hypothetical protein
MRFYEVTRQGDDDGSPPAAAASDQLRGLLSAWVTGAGASCSAAPVILPQLPAHAFGSPADRNLPVPSEQDASGLLGAWTKNVLPLPARGASAAAQGATELALAAQSAARPGHREREGALHRRELQLATRLDDAITGLAVLPQGQLAPHRRALQRLKSFLAEPMRIAIAGTCNSGKSSLANLIVGTDIIATGERQSCKVPTLILYAAEPVVLARQHDGSHCDTADAVDPGDIASRTIGAPVERLKSLEIVDLPGLEPTSGAAPFADGDLRSDVVLWCTAARPDAWGPAEREFWTRQPSWIKARSLLIITHPHLLSKSRYTERLLRRVYDSAEADFRDIILMSTETPSERGERRLAAWLRQLRHEARSRRVERVARASARIASGMCAALA